MALVVKNYLSPWTSILVSSRNSTIYLFYIIFISTGNPKDGIHLSRRPDVLLVSSSTQQLNKFGLLVCKVSEINEKIVIENKVV